MWHEGLEEASRMYFGEHNVDAMLTTLQPLHAMLDKGPETLREVNIYFIFIFCSISWNLVVLVRK